MRQGPGRLRETGGWSLRLEVARKNRAKVAPFNPGFEVEEEGEICVGGPINSHGLESLGRLRGTGAGQVAGARRADASAGGWGIGSDWEGVSRSGAAEADPGRGLSEGGVVSLRSWWSQFTAGESE